MYLFAHNKYFMYLCIVLENKLLNFKISAYG